MYEFLSPHGRYNDSSVITWNGIITTYGVIKHLAKVTEVKFATLEEIKLYNARR